MTTMLSMQVILVVQKNLKPPQQSETTANS